MRRKARISPAAVIAIIAQIVDGGFDPLAIPAAIGDTLLVRVTRVGSTATVNGFATVAASGAPQIVRTSLPRNKTTAHPFYRAGLMISGGEYCPRGEE